MARKKGKRPTYIYLNGELHKILHVNRPGDIVTTWNYPAEKMKKYIWSDVEKRMRPAFKLNEVAKLVNRNPRRIQAYLKDGLIKKPFKIYSLSYDTSGVVKGQRGGFTGKYLFSENDVYELHDMLLTMHRGAPRKDGGTTIWNLPTKTELRAMMNGDTIKYIKDEDGNFIPLWRNQF